MMYTNGSDRFSSINLAKSSYMCNLVLVTHYCHFPFFMLFIPFFLGMRCVILPKGIIWLHNQQCKVLQRHHISQTQICPPVSRLCTLFLCLQLHGTYNWLSTVSILCLQQIFDGRHFLSLICMQLLPSDFVCSSGGAQMDINDDHPLSQRLLLWALSALSIHGAVVLRHHSVSCSYKSLGGAISSPP